MSKYVRDDQKQEWYDNELIYICCSSYEIGDEIRDECKRRKIKHKYFPDVIEYQPRRSLTKQLCNEHMCKIEMCETGLKVRQLADWAITKFNDEIMEPEMMELSKIGINPYFVWIQPRREVSVGSGGYDEDGCFCGRAEHWRI